MCRIAGFQGRFDAGLLMRMGQTIAYRGPDDHEELLVPDAGVGLSHRAACQSSTFRYWGIS